MEQTNTKTRRDFLSGILKVGFISWVGALIYPIYNFMIPPKAEESKVSQVDAGKVNDMEKDSGKIVKFGNKPVILIRKKTGDFVAFSAVCTHLDCTVQYKKDYGQIYCACHNGRYDLNGKNVSGPPPAPLSKYNVSIQNDAVIIYQDRG